MKKISIDISDKEYYGCISGKINEKDPSNCSYDDLYGFSKSMLKAIAVGKPEDPPIEVGDIVVKYGVCLMNSMGSLPINRMAYILLCLMMGTLHLSWKMACILSVLIIRIF